MRLTREQIESIHRYKFYGVRTTYMFSGTIVGRRPVGIFHGIFEDWDAYVEYRI